MGRPVRTYEQLLSDHKKLRIQLMHVRANNRCWKKRTVAAETELKEIKKKIKDYVFIDKKPDYFYSFSGGLIFKRWYALNGISSMEAQFLILLSYVGTFFKETYKLFARNYIDKMPKIMPKLEEKGYVVKIKVPGKGRRPRNAWVLTQKGKDFEADYEKYYDLKMEERKTGKFTPFNFEDGAYFRRVYVTRHDRRKEQGGGMLPLKVAKTHRFIDASQIKIKNETTGTE